MNQRFKSDEGAMLVLAILVVTTIALVAGALLSKSSTNFKATVGLRAVAGSAYSGDAAAKIAINNLQLGGAAPSETNVSYPDATWVFNNDLDGTGCFGTNTQGTGTTSDDTARTTLNLKDVYPAAGSVTTPTSARVVCTPVLGSGVLGTGEGVEINGANSLPNAMTALGTGSGDGISISPKTGFFNVVGGVASSSDIDVSSGFLRTNSKVRAASCVLADIISPDKACAAGYVAPDPNYSSGLTSVPTLQAMPAGCTFSPGYYDDADALSAKTNSCSRSVFQPGTYYFDFHNNLSDPTANDDAIPNHATSSHPDTWNITRTVIGGVPTGLPDSAPLGKCVSPIDTSAAVGVRFIFGGDSRIEAGTGSIVELCGTYTKAQPPLVLVGQTTGVSAPLQSPAAIIAGTVNSSTTLGAWTAGTVAPGRLATADGTSATWTSGNSGNPSGALTLTALTPAGTIPAGSMVASAQLQVTHSEAITPPPSGTAAKPTVKFDAGSLTQTFTPPALRATLGTDNFDVKSVISKAVHDGTLANSVPTVTVVETGRNTTFNVDAVRLVITYYPPSLRGQTTTAIPGNCLFSTSCTFGSPAGGSSFKGTFVIQGATYLPSDFIDFSLGNQSQLATFRYGLVARAIGVGLQPNYASDEPFAALPDKGPGYGTNVTAVDIQVYLCLGQGSCTSGGTLALTSRVKITDPPSIPAAPKTRKIDVLSWSEQR